MSALSNGTYFISSTIGGSDSFYLAFKNGLTGEGLVIDTLIGSESQQWEVEAYSIPNIYAFKNRRYQTYIDVSPPDVERAPVVAAADPRRWYLTPTDSGYVVGIDASATLTWNVKGDVAEADTIVRTGPSSLLRQVTTNCQSSTATSSDPSGALDLETPLEAPPRQRLTCTQAQQYTCTESSKLGYIGAGLRTFSEATDSFTSPE
ncbi:hypothetical protein NMY22_g20171 [Coprinellus aureogranulatus]|nr:hypothetical protein NMY22_g20171 [Coprinellus aureogranulatus]